jgi:hypothetical protein
MELKKFNDLEGKTLRDVYTDHFEEILFILDDGSAYKLYHWQDCCESVTIESIVGDLQDLVGSPILMAEEVEGKVTEDDYGDQKYTFYKLATQKGYVDIRWIGTSNGYYSVSVNFDKVH